MASTNVTLDGLVYGTRDGFLGESLIGLDLRLSQADRRVLRPLAAQVAELAAQPSQAEKRDLWTRHNALDGVRPLVVCDPEYGWNEIFPPSTLRCQGLLARKWELVLRKEVFWGTELGDDTVILPEFRVPYVHDELDWGVAVDQIGGERGGAFTWDPPIKSAEDIDRLRAPTISVDRAQTDLLLEIANWAFEGLLDVRLATRWTPLFPMTKTLAFFRGLEQTMYDMFEAPDMVHRIMAFERDAYLSMLDCLEEEGLLSLNSQGAYVGSGGYGWSDELPREDFHHGVVRAADLWGFSESQETVSVSPEMFAEFVLPYQLPILERFGLNCYGCCEPLDRRWHLVETVPNLRRVSVAPRSDRAFMAEVLGDRYILSMKPDPVDLAMPSFDEERVRSQLRRDLEATRGCRVELIMKDNHTLGNEPKRAVRWVQIAREEIERL